MQRYLNLIKIIDFWSTRYYSQMMSSVELNRIFPRMIELCYKQFLHSEEIYETAVISAVMPRRLVFSNLNSSISSFFWRMPAPLYWNRLKVHVSCLQNIERTPMPRMQLLYVIFVFSRKRNLHKYRCESISNINFILQFSDVYRARLC